MEEMRNKKKCKTYRKKIAKWQKLFLISDYFKWVWLKFPNQKAEICRMNKNTGSSYILPKEAHFGSKDTNLLKVNNWKNISHANTNQKRVRWLY